MWSRIMSTLIYFFCKKRTIVLLEGCFILMTKGSFILRARRKSRYSQRLLSILCARPGSLRMRTKCSSASGNRGRSSPPILQAGAEKTQPQKKDFNNFLRKDCTNWREIMNISPGHRDRQVRRDSLTEIRLEMTGSWTVERRSEALTEIGSLCKMHYMMM